MPFPVGVPYPLGFPVAAPHAPVCRQFLGIGGKGGRGVAGIGVRCQGVGRYPFVQVYDPGGKGGFRRGGAGHRYRDADILGRAGGMPLDPYHLGIILGDHDVVDLVGGAEDLEGHGGRVVRRQVFIRVEGDGGDHIRVYPVFHIGGLKAALRHRRQLLEPHDAHTEAAYDVCVGLFPGGAARPCREP